MLDSHGVTAGTFILHARNHTVADAHHRGSLRRRIVHSCVRLDLAGHRMLSCIREARTDARIIERSLQEGLAHAFSLFIPPDVSAISLIVHHHRKVLSVMCEYSITHCIHCKHFPVAHLLVIHYPEAVAFLQGEEIHCPCIDVRKAHDKQRRDICRNHIVPKRCVYGDIRIAALDRNRLLIHPCAIWRTAREDDAARLVTFIYQILRYAFRLCVICMIGLSHAQSLHIEDRITRLSKVIGLLSRHSQRSEKRREKLSVLYLSLHNRQRVGIEPKLRILRKCIDNGYNILIFRRHTTSTAGRYSYH